MEADGVGGQYAHCEKHPPDQGLQTHLRRQLLMLTSSSKCMRPSPAVRNGWKNDQFLSGYAICYLSQVVYPNMSIPSIDEGRVN